jgi:hypothetical protein
MYPHRACLALACVLTCLAAATVAPADAAWQSLFDGQSLAGWRASDAPGTFAVVNGELVAHGARSHLFYEGPVAAHDFRNFEFMAEVLTRPHANSGVYIHTQFQEVGWPSRGYEVQINNSHSDPSRTGGLYGILTNLVAPAADDQWFTMYIRVTGKHILVRINDQVISDYVEPEHAERPPEFKDRLLSHGTFALQGHDPDSETHFRHIRVRLLP